MGSEIACVYAALILHDEGLEISAENISKILKASNVTVEAYWPTLFAKLCKGKDMGAMPLPAPPPHSASCPQMPSGKRIRACRHREWLWE